MVVMGERYALQSDVERHLGGLGPVRRAALFAEDLVDIVVLRELFREDLRELGLAVDVREQLLMAFRSPCLHAHDNIGAVILIRQ